MMYPLRSLDLKSAEPELQDTWKKLGFLPISETKDAKQSKTLTSKHKIHHRIHYHSREPLVQEQRNPSESSLRQHESNNLEIQGKSVHKGGQGESMAEQKEQTEHPDLHPWSSTRRPTLPRRNRRSNFSARREEDGIDLERGAERNGREWRLKGEWEKTDG